MKPSEELHVFASSADHRGPWGGRLRHSQLPGSIVVGLAVSASHLLKSWCAQVLF